MQTLLNRLAATGVARRGLGQLLAALALKRTGRQAEGDRVLADWAGRQADERVAEWGQRVYAGERVPLPDGIAATEEHRVLAAWLK
jgi:hypothetical protein